MSPPTPSKTGLKPILSVVPGSTIRPLEDENNRFSAERRQPIAVGHLLDGRGRAAAHRGTLGAARHVCHSHRRPARPGAARREGRVAELAHLMDEDAGTSEHRGASPVARAGLQAGTCGSEAGHSSLPKPPRTPVGQLELHGHNQPGRLRRRFTGHHRNQGHLVRCDRQRGGRHGDHRSR